jgi:hypothetical protein
VVLTPTTRFFANAHHFFSAGSPEYDLVLLLFQDFEESLSTSTGWTCVRDGELVARRQAAATLFHDKYDGLLRGVPRKDIKSEIGDGLEESRCRGCRRRVGKLRFGVLHF